MSHPIVRATTKAADPPSPEQQYETVCDLPVRAARFVPRKNWIVTGSDDMTVRVFNYNTLERIHSFEAHSDYVRCIVVHPTQPYLLTSSDDMLIKLWNWEKQWSCQQVFEGHTHYVMQIVVNPKDNNTFASASLDRTVKVWQLGSSTPNFTLEGHEKGVNCVDYYHGGDKPYLISGADDRLVKIWDYQNKTCVQTLEGHAQNISAVCFHPELPIVLTGSEDGTVRIWHAGTYRLESSLNYGLERVWTIACMRGSNNVSLGYDEGSIMVKVGREEPAVSMDVNGGKIIWARHSEVQQANLKAMNEGAEIKDGERLPLAVKDMGSCDIYPQTIAHNPNGRSVTGLAFYDWELLELVRRIEIQPRHVFWSESGELVCLATDDSYYILRYDSSIVARAQDTKEGMTEDGVEDAFIFLGEIHETVKTGLWVGDCFIYTNGVNRINYYVGGEIVTISHLDRTMYLLGYVPRDNRLYLGDKELNIVSYCLLLSVLEYQTAVMRGDFETADKVLPTIPRSQRTRVAHFLEKQKTEERKIDVPHCSVSLVSFLRTCTGRFTLPLYCRSGPQSMLSEPSVMTPPQLTAPALPIGSRDGHSIPDLPPRLRVAGTVLLPPTATPCCRDGSPASHRDSVLPGRFSCLPPRLRVAGTVLLPPTATPCCRDGSPASHRDSVLPGQILTSHRDFVLPGLCPITLQP
uniref:Beta'-coat protein n=1 Tax=Timema cristinae TaxID=61476 RepID=A0A7R9CE91_TIMCR|nr:unnamed protein product [Timema cristinae]